MFLGFPGGSDRKEPACKAKDLSSIPGSRRSTGEGHGNPLQCSCLETPMDRGAWWATVHEVPESPTWLSIWAHKHTHTRCVWKFSRLLKSVVWYLLSTKNIPFRYLFCPIFTLFSFWYSITDRYGRQFVIFSHVSKICSCFSHFFSLCASLWVISIDPCLPQMYCLNLHKSNMQMV